MKKLFTLALALMGFAGASNAATVDDLEVLKHSYVLVCDDLGARPGKGVLFGANHFLDVTGGSVATNKGQVDLSVVDGNEGYVTQEIVDKYGADYAGPHYNWLRLKNAQDVIAMKLTAGTKLIIFEQGNNKTGKEARIPKIAKSADLSDALNEAPGEDHPSTISGFRWEYTVNDDGLYYIGSYNGDMFVSFIIVEANEAPGTPTVKLGDQIYEDGLWFREVSVKANKVNDFNSIVTYTTDGSTPDASSPIYTAPIKCYQDMTLKFQAFMDIMEDGKTIMDGSILQNADNEANVSFSFDAPAIEAEGANVTIVSSYENARNFLSLDGKESGAEELSQVTLEESATIYAYSLIENGDYGTFKSKSTTKDVYVLNPIKEKKTIAVTTADVVLDEEATATSTTGEVYKVENGIISADKADFFVKNLSWGVVKNADYQIDGKEAYIKMSDTNISFLVAEGDSVNVKVICSKNACKNLDAEDAEDGSAVSDRMCYVNVSGTNYGGEDLKLNPDGNVIEFGLKGAEGGSIFTFQKYSGTGNIMISSIEITPATATPALADFADGKYYIQNLSSHLTWGAGNSWGTQASLVKHAEYITLHKQENGTYIIESQVSNGGESYYYGGDNGEYMDGKLENAIALTITKGEAVGTGDDGNPVYAYYITADGTNYYGWDGTENTVLARNLAAGDEKAQWVIFSEEQAIAGLAAGTAEEPVDATFLFLDPNFSRNNRNAGAWTGDTFGVGGDNTNTNAEKWGGNSQTFDISQTVDVPNGKYKITWNGFYRYNNTADNTNDVAVAAHADGTEVINAFVYINGKDYALTSIADDAASTALEGKLPFSQGEASTAFAQGLYAQSAEVIVTDGKLTIGIKKTEHLGTDWTVWDNFELQYFGAAAEPAVEETVLWEGTALVNGWADQPMMLSDGGKELTDAGAAVGDRLRIYFTAPDDNWQVELTNGHWDGMLDRYAAKDLGPEADGSPRHYTIVDQSKGYFEYTIDQDFLTKATTAQYWGGSFLLNGDGNMTVTKVSLVKGGDDTAVKTIKTVKAQNGAIYNLAGQKVSADYKGVVIINGKKVLNK